MSLLINPLGVDIFFWLDIGASYLADIDFWEAQPPSDGQAMIDLVINIGDELFKFAKP